jgi:two-component system nitrate/nitrite sensor histidine kinase NarX
MLDEGRLITNEEANLLSVFSTDIAQLIENSRLFGRAKALIVAEERNRLASDLHDSVTQTLFTASVLARNPRLWDKDQRSLVRIWEDQRIDPRALAEMRSMLLELRSGDQNQSCPNCCYTG